MCEESAEEVDGIMNALDEKDAELETKEAFIHSLQLAIAGLEEKATRLERFHLFSPRPLLQSYSRNLLQTFLIRACVWDYGPVDGGLCVLQSETLRWAA